VPHNTAPSVTRGAGGFNRGFDGLPSGVKLVIPGDNLDQPVAIRVVFKNDVVPQQLQESLFLENAANQHFQFQNGRRRFLFAFDGSPRFEPFGIRRQGTHAGLQAVRDDHGFVEGLAFRVWLFERDFFAVRHRIAKLAKPCQCGFFNVGFVDAHADNLTAYDSCLGVGRSVGVLLYSAESMARDR
jgi:hypothetical protein